MPALQHKLLQMVGSALYKSVTTAAGRYVPEKWLPFWNHPAGPQTVFFWSPTFKWGLVFAGLADYARPPEKLSLKQSTALGATGLVWARYTLVIKPRNLYLCSVNFLLGCTGMWQVFRIARYQRWNEKMKTLDSATVIDGVKIAIDKKKRDLRRLMNGGSL